MKLRVKGNEIFGPRKGHFLNRDDYLTEITLRNPQAATQKLLDFKINDGKIIGIRKAGDSKFISLEDKHGLSDLKSQMPRIENLIDSITSSKGNLNVLRRTIDNFPVYSAMYLAEKHDFPEQEVFTGKNTFGIDEVKSSQNTENTFTVRHSENDKGYVFESGYPWFTAGNKVSYIPYTPFPAAETEIKVIEDPNSVKVFKDIKTVPEFIKKLDQSEFKIITRTSIDLSMKDNILEKIKERLISSNLIKVSEKEAENFVEYINTKSENKNINDKLPKETIITNYWYPESNRRKPSVGVKFPGKEEIFLEIDRDHIEIFRKSLIIGSELIDDTKFQSLIKEWCQRIGNNKVKVCK